MVSARYDGNRIGCIRRRVQAEVSDSVVTRRDAEFSRRIGPLGEIAAAIDALLRMERSLWAWIYPLSLRVTFTEGGSLGHKNIQEGTDVF